MPEIEYDTDDLRNGGRQADHGAGAAGNASRTLGGAGGASPFGNVNGADALHGAVHQARQHHGIAAERASANLHTATTRATHTAALADDNTTETSRVAPHSATSDHVTRNM